MGQNETADDINHGKSILVYWIAQTLEGPRVLTLRAPAYRRLFVHSADLMLTVHQKGGVIGPLL